MWKSCLDIRLAVWQDHKHKYLLLLKQNISIPTSSFYGFTELQFAIVNHTDNNFISVGFRSYAKISL